MDDFAITAREKATRWSTREGAEIVANVLRGLEKHPARIFTIWETDEGDHQIHQIMAASLERPLGWIKIGDKPNVATTKVYPSRLLEERIRDLGHNVRCLWEIPGPPDTAIAWLVAYAIGKGVVIVQTYANHDRTRSEGWDAFTACGQNDVGATLDDVLVRCGL